MNKEGQLFYYNTANNYWWIRSKYNIILYLLKIYCRDNISSERKESKILDIGSGPGNMLHFLKKYGRVWGNDTSQEAVDFCRRSGFDMLEGDLDKDEINTKEKFDLITMIDVLEHLEHDVADLEKIRKMMKDEARLIITVPAYRFLWGAHDVKYGHYRRYTLTELRTKLKNAGFKIEKISYIQPLFLFPLLVFRMLKKFAKKETDDFVHTPRILNNILLKIIESEKYYLKFFNFYFGPTIVAIAEK